MRKILTLYFAMLLASLLPSHSWAVVVSGLTATDQPSDHLVDISAGAFDGVVRTLTTRLVPGGFATSNCSGALLTGGKHVLTAAHCVQNSASVNEMGLEPDTGPQGTLVTFELASGEVPIFASNIVIHPSFGAGLFEGNDIAIIELASDAPADADQYEIFRGSNEIGQVFERIGHGPSGVGATGIDETTFPSAKRAGLNLYDALGDVFGLPFPSPYVIPFDGISTGIDISVLPGPTFGQTVLSGALLAYDFDNGMPLNDAFGYWYGPGFADTGVLDLAMNAIDVFAVEGDSGGPAFIDGKIAGISSFIFSFIDLAGNSADVSSTVLNSSFGEFALDTRVSSYAGFIDDIIGAAIGVPEPSSSSLAAIGLLVLLFPRLRLRFKVKTF